MDICPPAGVDSYMRTVIKGRRGRWRGSWVDLALYSRVSFSFCVWTNDRNQLRRFHLYLPLVQDLCFADEILFCSFGFYGLWKGVRPLPRPPQSKKVKTHPRFISSWRNLDSPRYPRPTALPVTSLRLILRYFFQPSRSARIIRQSFLEAFTHKVPKNKKRKKKLVKSLGSSVQTPIS